MTRELLLLRHGKAEPEIMVDDFSRPLKRKGKRHAQRVGTWLLQQGLLPDHVLSSPARRAIVTAEKACKAMGLGVQHIHTEQRIYQADTASLLTVLKACPAESKRVMLVGHNPGLERLLVKLVKDKSSLSAGGGLMNTTSLARLNITTPWHALAADAVTDCAIQHSAELPKRFPFPASDGVEWRERPAYYYTQSAVIPYRINEGAVEVLAISSSRGSHWLYPKGIKEPGLTPQASAAREAYEEAGIEGVVADMVLGSYSYEKWGGRCEVQVYAMQVSNVLSDTAWEERHRQRRWLTPQQAAQCLKQAELRELTLQLARGLEQQADRHPGRPG